MITILHFKQTDSEKPPKYTVTEEGDNVVIRFYNIPFHRQTASGKCTINIKENAEKVIDVYVRDSDRFCIAEQLYAYEFCSRSGYSVPPVGGVKILRVVIDDNENVFIALTFCHPDIDGYTNIEMIADEESVSGVLCRECEWFAELFAKAKLKHRLIKNVDPYASLSYLEAQIDLLTKAVLCLASGESLNDEYVESLKEADKQSVLNIKPLSAITAEFTEKKAAFREQQEKYYENFLSAEKETSEDNEA